MLTSGNAISSRHFGEVVWRRILAAGFGGNKWNKIDHEAVAARGRQAAMVAELRKVELVRDRLESLQQLVSS